MAPFLVQILYQIGIYAVPGFADREQCNSGRFGRQLYHFWPEFKNGLAAALDELRGWYRSEEAFAQAAPGARASCKLAPVTQLRNKRNKRKKGSLEGA
jgi:hypothetical protein